MKDKYKEARNLLDSNVVKNNCIKMLIASILVGVGLPVTGYLMNSVIAYYVGFLVTGVMCVPGMIYSLRELIFKTSEKDIRNSVNIYENFKFQEVKQKEIEDQKKEEMEKQNSNKPPIIIQEEFLEEQKELCTHLLNDEIADQIFADILQSTLREKG